MDAAVSRRMLDRVIDQVDPDLLQKRSGLLPAKKAAKKDPVIALWIEQQKWRPYGRSVMLDLEGSGRRRGENWFVLLSDRYMPSFFKNCQTRRTILNEDPPSGSDSVCADLGHGADIRRRFVYMEMQKIIILSNRSRSFYSKG